MNQILYGQLVGACAGAGLLTSVLMVWRRSLVASLRLLAVQGASVAALVAVIGLEAGAPEVLAVAVLVFALKAVALPRLLAKSAAAAGDRREAAPRLSPAAALLGVAFLTTLAYLVSRPVAALVTGPAGRAVGVGLAMVLIGFLVLVTRRRAHSQLIGFLLLDNGIAMVAFLTAGGVPIVVELGVSLDVLLVVLVLQVLTTRMRLAFGGTDLDDLRELRD